MELEPWGREEKRFSTLVAEEKNASHHNISKNGACNDWIVSHAIQYFKNGNTCDTAIIQFSAPERWRYYDPDERKWRNIGSEKTTNNLRTINEKDAHFWYYKKIYTIELAVQNYWKNVFLIDNYLKDKCKVIYLTLGYPVTRNEWTPDVKIKSVKELVQKMRLVGHPSPKGHRRIADYILKNLKGDF